MNRRNRRVLASRIPKRDLKMATDWPAEVRAAVRALLDRYADCPKCHGQYSRQDWLCHCYQCCFEWDLREPEEAVVARARRRHQGERPSIPFWAEVVQEASRLADAG
jgi:hypothetical protein